MIYDAFGKMVAEYGGNPQPDEGGVKYYLQDWQGSVRAGVNAGGFVKSRTDHQAFGENIGSGVGLRTTAQGFGAPQANRQGYGLTERDSATGLNHTWFRKNENRAGRWTSPDPYNGSASVGNPQSWNRYSYVENEPTNSVDPCGLHERAQEACTYSGRTDPDGNPIYDGHIVKGRCVSSAGRINHCASFVNEIADTEALRFNSSGMGPLAYPRSDGGMDFASIYALISGVAVLVIAGFASGPVGFSSFI